MEEEPDAEAIEAAAEECGQRHEVVIMDPNIVVLRVDDLDHLLEEVLVGEDVGLPGATVKPAAAGGHVLWSLGGGEGEHVMEERPEVALAEVLVKSVVEVGREEDRGAAEAVDEGLRDLLLLGGGHVGAEGADEEHLHLVGDAVAEAEEERVVVP